MNLKRSLVLLLLSSAVLTGCGGDEGVKCTFKNPIVIDEGPAQWPKFRRDSQNTGTIVLPNAGYEAVAAADRPRREATWVFPPVDETARGPFPASASLNSATGDDRRLYIGSADGTFFVLRASDGARVSNFGGDGILFTAAPIAITSTALVGTLDLKDAIVVGTGDSRLFGIDGDGFILQDIWPFITDSFIRASPAMTVDGLFLTGTIGSGAFGVCPNGVGRFGITVGSTESSPAVGRDPNKNLDGTFFSGANDRRLRAIRSDGILRWTFSMSAPIVSSPVVQLSPDNTQTAAIYVADVDGLVSKIDSNGEPFVDFGFVRGSIGPTESSPALTRHPNDSLRLYLGSDDGNLYAIDAATGAVLWSFATGGVVRSSPAVVRNADRTSNPIVIVGSFDGSLYYVEDLGAEPSLVGTFAVPASDSPTVPTSIESSPAVDFDGTVIFGSDNGRIYAVR